MHDRRGVELIGDETLGGTDNGQDSWMISYLDVLTLIIAFFVLMLALSEPKSDDSEVPEPEQSISRSGGEPEPDVATLAEETPPPVPEEEGAMGEQSMTVGGNAQEMLDALADLQLQGVEVMPGEEGITLRISEELLFASGQAELTIDGLLLMEHLQSFLLLFTGEISVEGHSDSIPINTPQFPSNWELSSARAIAVVRFFEEGQIPASRLRAVGYAASQPLSSNATAEGRAVNRRVELVLRDR